MLIFIKKRLQPRCFPVNISKFLRTAFLQNTSGDCFWKTTLNRALIEKEVNLVKVWQYYRKLAFRVDAYEIPKLSINTCYNPQKLVW